MIEHELPLRYSLEFAIIIFMRKRYQTADYKFLGSCPICNKRFASSDASPLEGEEDMRILYVECKSCASSVVLGVVKNIPGLVTTVGMLTDMKREDIDRMRSLSPLTADDVLEMHAYLEQK